MGFILTQTALLSLFKFTFLMPKFSTSLLSVASYLKTSVVWTPERAGPGTVLQHVASLLMNTLGNRFPRPQVLGEVVPSVQGIVSTGQSFWTPTKKRIEVRLARFPLTEHRLAFGAVFPKYTCKLPSSNYWLWFLLILLALVFCLSYYTAVFQPHYAWITWAAIKFTCLVPL